MGFRVARGKAKLAKALPDILVQETPQLRPRIRLLIEELRVEWRGLDERIQALDHELSSAARQDQAARGLTEVPGIDPLTATALVAAVGRQKAFEVAEISLRGSGWYPAKQPREASRNCSGLANEETNICDI